MSNMREPTPEEKRRLQGHSNVEALIFALDQRLSQKTPIILVGRASYELGDPETTEQIRKILKDEHRVSDVTHKLILTDDIDCYATEAIEEAANLAHEGSYLSKLADCYLHALNERTLVLPQGWATRTEPIPLSGLQYIEPKRLNPLDFVICKGAAGRIKDWNFLAAFTQIKGINLESIQQKALETLAHPSAQLRFDTVAQNALRRLAINISKASINLSGEGPQLGQERT